MQHRVTATSQWEGVCEWASMPHNWSVLLEFTNKLHIMCKLSHRWYTRLLECVSDVVSIEGWHEITKVVQGNLWIESIRTCWESRVCSRTRVPIYPSELVLPRWSKVLQDMPHAEICRWSECSMWEYVWQVRTVATKPHGMQELLKR
jgi:hypothetical protein